MDCNFEVVFSFWNPQGLNFLKIYRLDTLGAIFDSKSDREQEGYENAELAQVNPEGLYRASYGRFATKKEAINLLYFLKYLLLIKNMTISRYYSHRKEFSLEAFCWDSLILIVLL